MSSLAVGTPCILLDHCPEFSVFGIIGDVRKHHDDPSRLLYYFTCVQVDDSVAVEAVVEASEASGPVVRSWRRPDAKTIISPDGYTYDCSGWYEETCLMPIDWTSDTSLAELLGSQTSKPPHHPSGAKEAPPTQPTVSGSSQPQEDYMERLVRRAETDNAPCELQYIGLSFRPWFTAPFAAMGYIPLINASEARVAFSMYICHRCLGPYADLLSLVGHLELCRVSHPPGFLIYRNACDSNPSSLSGLRGAPLPEVRAYVIDGAEDVVYCRHLAMLMKCFVESKVIQNDVDMYEFVVVTANRTLAAAWCSESSLLGEAGAEELLRYDADRWDGQVVAGFYCRLKQLPNVGLSCIATLPCFQKCGVGKLLVRLAYFLGFLRQRYCGCALCGDDGCGIDRPFSVSGNLLLHSTWKSTLLPVLAELDGASEFTLDGLRRRCSDGTFMHLSKEDFFDFLLTLDMGFYATGGEGTIGCVVVDKRLMTTGGGSAAAAPREGTSRVACHHILQFDAAHVTIPSTAAPSKGLGSLDESQMSHFVRIMFHDMADHSGEMGLAVESGPTSV